jgi:hypothetical protein
MAIKIESKRYEKDIEQPITTPGSCHIDSHGSV